MGRSFKYLKPFMNPALVFVLAVGVVFASCSRQRGVASAPAPAEPAQQTVSAADALTREEDSRRFAFTTADSIALGEAAFRERTNRALDHLVLAQLAVEDRMPNLALYEINRSLYFLETADGLALKGSILYLLGNVEEARIFWQNARNMNPAAIHRFLPGIPEAFP